MAQMIAPLAQQMPQQPLGGQDPRSQYLAAAIQALQSRSQGSGQGLGANLISQMLLQKAYGGSPGQGQQGGGMQGDANDPGNMMGGGPAPAQAGNGVPQVGGGMGNSPGIFGMGQQALAQGMGNPTMQGQMDPLQMQGQQGNSWPFG
jgi:hypothetical protein